MRKETCLSGLAFASEIMLWLALLLAPTQLAFEVREQTHLAVSDPLIWGAAGLRVLVVLIKRDWRGLLPPLWGGMGFVLWSLISAVWVIRYPEFRSVASMLALKDIVQYVEYFVLLPFVLRPLFEQAWRRKAFLILLGLQFAAIGFYGVMQVHAETQAQTFDPLAVTAWFGSRNVLGGFLSLVLPLGVGVLLGLGVWPTVVALLPLLLFGLSINMAGGSVLAITVALLVIGFARGWRFFLIVVVALLLWHQPFRFVRKLNFRYADIDSIMQYAPSGEASRRYPEWQAAFTVSYDFPWVGLGTGQYQQNIGQFYGVLPDPTGPNEPDTQNLYLVLLASMGIPAVILFLTMLLDGMRGAMRGYAGTTKPLPKGIALGAMGSLLAFAINCIWAPLLVRGIGVHLVTIIMLSMSCGSGKRSAPEPEGDEKR